MLRIPEVSSWQQFLRRQYRSAQNRPFPCLVRNRSKHFVDCAKPTRKIACDVQNHDCVLVRLVPKEMVKISTLQRKEEAVLDRPQRGSTGQALDDRHLTEEISRSKGCKNRFTRLLQVFHDFYSSRANDKNSITGFVFPHDNFDGPKFRLFDRASTLCSRICLQST